MKNIFFSILFSTLLISCGRRTADTDKQSTTTPDTNKVAAIDNSLGIKDANGLKQGHWTITNKTERRAGYTDDEKVFEGDYKDDKRQGIWIENYPGGAIESRIMYKDDSIVSTEHFDPPKNTK